MNVGPIHLYRHIGHNRPIEPRHLLRSNGSLNLDLIIIHIDTNCHIEPDGHIGPISIRPIENT